MSQRLVSLHVREGVKPLDGAEQIIVCFEAGAGRGDTFAPKSRLKLASDDPAASCAA